MDFPPSHKDELNKHTQISFQNKYKLLTIMDELLAKGVILPEDLLHDQEYKAKLLAVQLQREKCMTNTKPEDPTEPNATVRRHTIVQPMLDTLYLPPPEDRYTGACEYRYHVGKIKTNVQVHQIVICTPKECDIFFFPSTSLIHLRKACIIAVDKQQRVDPSVKDILYCIREVLYFSN